MPETFEWLPDYSVGNKLMDDQHKKLLSICAEISTLSKGEPSDLSERFHDVLNELSKYAYQHFESEEALLANLNYPELSSQRSEHIDYLTSLSEILLNAVEGNLNIQRLNQFTARWWIDHILNSDMKYKPYLETKS